MSFFLTPGLDATVPLDPDAVGLGGPCPISGHTGGAGVGPGLALEGSMGSSFLDMDGMFTAAGCGMPSAHNFLLPDELPSPLDASLTGLLGPAALDGVCIPFVRACSELFTRRAVERMTKRVETGAGEAAEANMLWKAYGNPFWIACFVVWT